MSAILESYASEDRSHMDYLAVSNSEEFRRYICSSFLCIIYFYLQVSASFVLLSAYPIGMEIELRV